MAMEHYFGSHDILSDVKSLKAKCKELDIEWDDIKRVVEQNKDTESDYQHVLSFVLGNFKMNEQHKRGRDQENDVYDDDELNDPEYDLFLGQLQEHGNAYAINGVPVFIRYEAESGSEDGYDNQMNQVEEENSEPSNQKLGHSKIVVVESRCEKNKVEKPRKIKVFMRNDSANEDHEPKRNDVVQIDNLCDHANQARPGENDKTRSQMNLQKLDKGKNVVREDPNKKAVVRIENERLYQKPHQRSNQPIQNQDEDEDEDQIRPLKEYEVQYYRRKLLEGKSINVQADNEANKNLHEKPALRNHSCEGVHRNTRNVKFDTGSMAHEKKDKNNLEKECDDKIVPDVEILDELNREILTSFVLSKKFHKSMRDDDAFQQHGSSSVRSEFREQVLNILKKPFDKEEYNNHQNDIKDGSYLHYYPDLGKTLKKYRYNRGKCLTILRGFFYWLQNLTQEGVFRPWKDRECLTVKPGSA